MLFRLISLFIIISRIYLKCHVIVNNHIFPYLGEKRKKIESIEAKRPMKTSKTEFSGVFKIQQEEARLNNEALVRKSQTGFFCYSHKYCEMGQGYSKACEYCSKETIVCPCFKVPKLGKVCPCLVPSVDNKIISRPSFSERRQQRPGNDNWNFFFYLKVLSI